MTDYVVEAELMLDPDVPNSNPGNRFFRVVARNYEWTIQFSGDEKSSMLRLYDRTNKKELATNTEFDAEKGQFYKLTLVVSGNRIMGYVDGKLWLDMRDDSNTTGPVGIRAGGGPIRARNFVVRKVTTKDLSGELQNGESDNNPGTGENAFLLWSSLGCLMATAYILFNHFKRTKA